jgi:hypothetical protein
MRVEKIEVPAYVRSGMEKPLRYLFARADKGGAGWIGRLDAPKEETFGGIMFYAEKGASVVHVLALSETEDKMWPICKWTCKLPDGWEEIVAYMPPATAYCARDTAYRIPLHGGDRWWVEQCQRVARLFREGLVVPRFSAYRKGVEEDKRDMLLRWRMGEPRPAPRHKAWRLDWMVGAGMTPWDMARRETTYPMEKDNPVGRRMMRLVAAFRRDYM